MDSALKDLNGKEPLGPSSTEDFRSNKPDENGGDVDANSEIGEIDRRLNALQNFLKQAKNGIITRIPAGV